MALDHPSAAETSRAPRWLAPTVDYGPLLVFVLAYTGFDILTATAAMVAATALALLLSLALTRRVSPISLIVSATVIAFGGLTLWLADARYLKMQSTLINLLFSLVLAGALALRQPLLPSFFAGAVTMSERGWRRMTLRLSIFFAAMAALNELIAQTMSTAIWASYYSFGTTLLTLLFLAAQWPLIRREAPARDAPAGDDRR